MRHYCREAGHWKSNCPMFWARKQHAGGGRVKPSALAARVPSPEDVGQRQGGHAESGVTGGPGESYQPFISEGFVTQAGSDTKMHVKILRDTGADNSYVVESILPFSEETDTGDEIFFPRNGVEVVASPGAYDEPSLWLGAGQGAYLCETGITGGRNRHHLR